MNKRLAVISFLGAITIILGAFGAHALKEILSVDQLKSFDTAVRYQFFHVLVLLVINMYAKFSSKDKKIMSYLFFGGIICFSGSIYAITFGVPAKAIWFVTPLGGLIFVMGWLKMGISFFKAK